MIRFRPFLNTDPPLIVEVWRRQHSFRQQLSALTRDVLDRHVFSKTYFDREGFILAIDEQESDITPLGFVHAGFPPNEQLNDLDTTSGIVSQLKVVPGEAAMEVAAGLLKNAEDYLRRHGASRVHVGAKFPFSPFYNGLYGGSRIPGVMENDELTRNLLTEYGFQTDERIVVMERTLAGFRAQIDREQMTLRRQYQIKAVVDPVDATWWESSTYGLSERDCFEVSHKLHRNVCASVSYWDMQPLANEWGASCRGMYNLKVTPELRRCGMATFLVGESLRHLMLQGIGRVQAQSPESSKGAMAVFRKLGFEAEAYGYLMSKTL